MWTQTQRILLDAVLDELVPPSNDGTIPGAGALGVADFLPTADAYAPNPVEATQAVMTALGDSFVELTRPEKVAALHLIETQQPNAFATLVRLTYMGYYSRPDTRPLFGVGAHPVHPQGYPVPREDEALMDELTAPVRARGKVYRDAK